MGLINFWNNKKPHDFDDIDLHGGVNDGTEFPSGSPDGTIYENVKFSVLKLWDFLKTKLVQSDWDQADSGEIDYIKNKPTIPVVPTNLSEFVDDLGHIENVQADWDEASSSAESYINNKPIIPTVPTNLSGFVDDLGHVENVQADWTEASPSAESYINNKPTIPTLPSLVADRVVYGNYLQDSNLVWVGSKLGVGVSAPTAKLHVVGDLMFKYPTGTESNFCLSGNMNGSMTGTNNFAFAEVSLNAITSGTYNAVFGYDLLSALTIGSFNTVFGNGNLKAATNPTYNFATGLNLGAAATTAVNNLFVGTNSARYAVSISNCAFSGNQNVGASTGTLTNVFVFGDRNFFTTTGSLSNVTTFGQQCLRQVASSTDVIAIGYRHVYNDTAAINNSIYLGFEQGWSSSDDASASYRLAIGMYRNNALIYGEFDNERLRVNGTFEISNTPTASGSYKFIVKDDTSDEIQELSAIPSTAISGVPIKDICLVSLDALVNIGTSTSLTFTTLRNDNSSYTLTTSQIRPAVTGHYQASWDLKTIRGSGADIEGNYFFEIYQGATLIHRSSDFIYDTSEKFEQATGIGIFLLSSVATGLTFKIGGTDGNDTDISSGYIKLELLQPLA